MKLKIDRTLLKYVYFVVLATILYVIYRLISSFEYILGAIIGALSGLLAVLAPFIIALVVAYLLHPIVCWIESNVMYNKRITKTEADCSDKHKKLKRTMSVLLTYLLVLGLLVVLLYSSYAMIGGKISSQVDINSVIESLISYSERYIHIFSQLRSWLENSGLSDNLKQQLIDTVESANELISSAISNSFIKIKSFGSNIVNIVLGLILAFYILKDIEYFRELYGKTAKALIKEQKNEKLNNLFEDINSILSHFIRGQLLAALIVGILSSIGLSIIRLDFAILIGMTAGIANIIPYFGPILGSVPAVIVGLLSGNPVKALLAIIVLVAVQQIDGTLISPRIVESSVGLHPVFVMLAIIIGGAYLGLLGMLIAVPIAAIIKMFLVRWMENKKNIEA
ncbi:MAG: AI-2E family transporter [Clostridia bacterium]|jgi:predicted PurR-regulated permease PerM|nr:AI-2E family transporter [Clostridia bacterium]